MAEKHVHKVYGSFPPWGKSVEFPATGGGGNYVYYDLSNIPKEPQYAFYVMYMYATTTKIAGFGTCSILGGRSWRCYNKTCVCSES